MESEKKPESNSSGSSPASRTHNNISQAKCAQNEPLNEEHAAPSFSPKMKSSDQRNEASTEDKNSSIFSQATCQCLQTSFKPGNPFRDMARVFRPKLCHNEVHACEAKVIRKKSSEDSSLDDSSALEFSNLQLKLRSPVESPKTNLSVNTTRQELQKPGFPHKDMPNVFQNEKSVSQPNNENCFLPRNLDDGQFPQMHPTAMSETVHQQPKAIQSLEIHQPEIWPNRSFTSIDKNASVPLQSNLELGQTSSDGCIEQLRGTPKQTHEQSNTPRTIEVQSRNEDLKYESFNLQPSSSSALSLAHPLHEADSITEVILSPATLPRIDFQQPSPYEAVSTSYFGIQSPLLVSGYAQRASTSFSPKEPLPPPPPYSECVKDREIPKSPLDHKASHPTFMPPLYCGHYEGMSSSKPNATPKSNCRKGIYCVNDYTRFSRESFGNRMLADSQDSPCSHQRMEPPVSDHQALAFVSCLFCWPIGLVAIYYSNMCHILKSEGDNEQAHTYARLAFIASLSALCSGVVGYIIMFFYERGI